MSFISDAILSPHPKTQPQTTLPVDSAGCWNSILPSVSYDFYPVTMIEDEIVLALEVHAFMGGK